MLITLELLELEKQGISTVPPKGHHYHFRMVGIACLYEAAGSACCSRRTQTKCITLQVYKQQGGFTLQVVNLNQFYYSKILCHPKKTWRYQPRGLGTTNCSWSRRNEHMLGQAHPTGLLHNISEFKHIWFTCSCSPWCERSSLCLCLCVCVCVCVYVGGRNNWSMQHFRKLSSVHSCALTCKVPWFFFFHFHAFIYIQTNWSAPYGHIFLSPVRSSYI
jgi:hypothetical protein